MEPLVYAGSAFLLGALHGLEPGHGKTVMAAYLVGSRGDARHAAALGAIVTLTHTCTVILMAIVALFATAYFVPQQLEHYLEAGSGLLVTAVGGWMLYTRVLSKRTGTVHHHDHDHDHPGEHSHSHVGSGEGISLGNLLTMGVSGGMVPCPAALAILLAATALGKLVGGLAIVIVFSMGLATALVCIGIALIKAAGLASRLLDGNRRLVAWISAASAVIVLGMGLLLTLRAALDIWGA